jgi:hypothetical protein
VRLPNPLVRLDATASSTADNNLCFIALVGYVARKSKLHRERKTLC